jgi:SAM-dependent methyltransferase
MIRAFLDRLRLLSLQAPPLEHSQVVMALGRHGVEPWFLYAFEQWQRRWHVWRGMIWVVKHVGAGAVLETGCGCGWNLFWLAANGFGPLSGIDLDAAAIAAGNELSGTAGLPLQLCCDNALDPETLKDRQFHLILALNWTYHVPGFDLGLFLERYRRHLGPGGLLLLDVVDRAYDEVPNSRYLTSDWARPVGERRPSEYLHRYYSKEVREIAASRGYRVAASFHRGGAIPRSVYLLVLGDPDADR